MVRLGMDLDVKSVEDVPSVLREAATMFFEAGTDLEKEFGDKEAGRPWDIIAEILDDAADKIESKLGI